VPAFPAMRSVAFLWNRSELFVVWHDGLFLSPGAHFVTCQIQEVSYEAR
jgi:hypothetical protein